MMVYAAWLCISVQKNDPFQLHFRRFQLGSPSEKKNLNSETLWYSRRACSEDRATLESDLSAAVGEYTEGQGH